MKVALKIGSLLVSTLLFTPSYAQQLNASNDSDFDFSMGKDDSYYGPAYTKCMEANSDSFYALACMGTSCAEKMKFFRSLYEKNHPAKLAAQQTYKIPPIIHLIWLGSKFPEKFAPYRKSWHTNHPTWTHIFWVDNPENYAEGELLTINDADTFKKDLLQGKYAGKSLVIDVKNIKLVNQNFYNETNNYGEKSDIFRYEILYRFGGMYADTDEECLKSCDLLHKMYDFYVGIQPLDVDVLALGNSLFAASPDHPILKHSIETIKDDHDFKPIWIKTGPVHLTKSFFMLAQDENYINVAFPATYFNPIGLRQHKVTPEQKKMFARQEPFAIHWWAKSWGKK